MVRSTSSKPMGVAVNEHSYKLLLLLYKLKVLGALFDARPINFFIDDGTGFITREEIREHFGLPSINDQV